MPPAMVHHGWVIALAATSMRSTWWSQTVAENRDFCLPHLHSTPRIEGSQLEYCHDVWCLKSRMVWLHNSKKIWRYVYLFWQNPRTWRMDGYTDTAWRHRLHLYSIVRQNLYLTAAITVDVLSGGMCSLTRLQENSSSRRSEILGLDRCW